MPKTKKAEYQIPPLYLVHKEGSPEFYKVTLEGFFTQTEIWGIAVVAVLTIVNEQLKGWKAYMGACDARREQEICDFARRSGNKLGFDHARFYFKDQEQFPRDLYDNGW